MTGSADSARGFYKKYKMEVGATERAGWTERPRTQESPRRYLGRKAVARRKRHVRSRAERLTDRLAIDRPDDALLGDDAGDQLGGGDVEGGVIDVDALGGGLTAEAVGDLARVALFD